jgi:hypothetical protein
MSRSRVTLARVPVLTTMFANSSGSLSRPCVLIVSWVSCPRGTGGCPIWPAATCTFCCWIDWITSPAVIPRVAISSGSSQTRIE